MSSPGSLLLFCTA